MARDGDGSGGGGGGAPLVVAYYISNPDVRETRRAREVVEQFLAAGHQVHVVVDTPGFVRTNERMHIRQVDEAVVECGIPNVLTLDRCSTLDKYYDTYMVPREPIIREESNWLKKIQPSLLIWQVSESECHTSESGSDKTSAGTITPLKSMSELVVNGLGPKSHTKEKAIPQLHDCKSSQVVHTCEKTPSPPSKRQRGRSVPPPQDNSHLGRRRSSSSPPSPDRVTAEDERTAVAKAILNPITVFWDIQNCSIPKDAKVEQIVGNMKRALFMNYDSVTVKAYGASEKVKKGLENCGVKLVDAQNKKDAADKLILVDMVLCAYDGPKDSSILLISGDGDFTRAVQELVQRGHTVVVAVPSVYTSAASLINAGSYIWEWPSLAKGYIVTPMSLPDNIDAVKAHMLCLFYSKGGHIELIDILPQYQKTFGKQIRLANYDVTKLVDLFLAMGNPFVVMESMVFLDTMQVKDPATSIAPEALDDDLADNTEDEAYAPWEDECPEDRLT